MWWKGGQWLLCSGRGLWGKSWKGAVCAQKVVWMLDWSMVRLLLVSTLLGSAPPHPQNHSALNSASFCSFLEDITTHSVRREKYLIWLILLQWASWEENSLGKYLLPGCSLIPAHKQNFPFHVYIPLSQKFWLSVFTKDIREDGRQGSWTRRMHKPCEDSQETTQSHNVTGAGCGSPVSLEIFS